MKYPNSYDIVGKVQQVGDLNVVRAKSFNKWFWVNVADWEHIGGEYDYVDDIHQVGDLWIFKAMLSNRVFWVNIADGTPIGGEYDKVGDIQKVGELWVFKAKLGNEEFWVNTTDGNPICGKYDSVGSIEGYGDLRYFKACLDGKEFLINTADATSLDVSNYYVRKVLRRKANLILLVSDRKSNHEYFVSFSDGKKIGREYEHIETWIQQAGDIWVCAANLLNGNWSFINTATGEPVLGEYDCLFEIRRVNNLWVFPARKNDKWFVVNAVTGEPIWGEYKKIEFYNKDTHREWLFNAKNNNRCYQPPQSEKDDDSLWVFKAMLNDKWCWVNFADGEPLCGCYDDVGWIKKFDYLWVFPVKLDGKWFFVNIESGERVWGVYDWVENEIWDAGDLKVFKAELQIEPMKDIRFWVNIYNGKPIWGTYKDVCGPFEKAGDLILFRANDRGWFWVNTADGKPITKKFSFIEGSLVRLQDDMWYFSATYNNRQVWVNLLTGGMQEYTPTEEYL